MAHPLHHAESTQRRHGGRVDDYIDLHSWFDASKAYLADFRHRALRHHAQGIFEAETVFGKVIINSDGRRVPVRVIGEQHVKEDCGGRIPCLSDWLARITPAPWMSVGHLDRGHPVAGPGKDLSLDAWVMEVSTRQTVLGYEDWRGRMDGCSVPSTPPRLCAS
ncbi:MAG: hypothetical protein AAGH68_02270 [Pseudomonadota bacterium]